MRETIRRLGPAGILGVLASTVPLVGSVFVLGSIKWAAPWMGARPLTGPAAALLASTVLGGTMLMPTYSFAALCGAAFGSVEGTAIAIAGIVLGGAVNVSWARPLCGTRVLDLIDERPKLALLHRELLRSNPRRAFLLLTLIRVPPGFPFSLTNLLVAALHVPLPLILISVAIGSIPRTAIVAMAANRIAEGGADLGWWPLMFTVVSALLLLIIVGRIASTVLRRMTNQPAEPAPPAA